MKANLRLMATLWLVILFVGCQQESNTSSKNSGVSTSDAQEADQLDFSALLDSVDNSIGKRFQSTQMEAIDSASYRYDGPIQKVLDIVAPKAKEAGFKEETDETSIGMGPAEKEMQQKMGFDMKSVEQRMFTHPSGDVLTVVRMDISSDDLDVKMLTIQLMNPQKMADFGNTMKKPSSTSLPPQTARFYDLSELAKSAFDEGKTDEARACAEELLKLAPQFKRDWNYGNAIHHGNLILGRIALLEDRIDDAKKHLLEAGNSPGSPQMDSFGPNMTLARELLKKGEQEVVLEYFELCRTFWDMGHDRLDKWAKDVKAGSTPEFGPNLLY